MRHFGVIPGISGPYCRTFDTHYTFCVFCNQAEIKQTSNHPIKIRQIQIESAKTWPKNARDCTEMTYYLELTQEFLDSSFWEQTPDFTTRLMS